MTLLWKSVEKRVNKGEVEMVGDSFVVTIGRYLILVRL